MSLLYHTTGIILSRNDYREVDHFYSALTREHGKIEFLARGGRKPLAKLVPHLEFAAEVELLVVRGRVFQTVAGVEQRRAFSEISKRLSQLLLARNAFYLMDIVTKPHETDFFLYDFLIDWLDFLDKSPFFSEERSAYILGTFALKLLSLVGYHPEFRICLSCHQSIREQSYRFHALRGGVVCELCVLKEREHWYAARPIHDSVLKLTRFALEEPFQAQLNVFLSAEYIYGFHEVVELLLVNHFPTIPPSSLRSACLA